MKKLFLIILFILTIPFGKILAQNDTIYILKNGIVTANITLLK